tara:strand:+ start:2812 stop:3525 length:714 start_codon:yes stop_codon:yes gene_type:complete
MSISTDEVKQRVELVSAKDQKTGYLPSSRFNNYAAIAQDMIISELRKSFESGLVSSDALSDLKTRLTINVPTTGRYAKPSDYLYYSAMYVNILDKNKQGEQFSTSYTVDPVTDSQLGDRRSSMVSPPTKQRPIVIEYNTYLQMYPENTGLVELVYLRQPLIPFWNFTVASNEQVYAATGGSETNPNAGVTAGDSTDFDLPYQLKDDLVFTICQLLGVTVRQPDLFQSTQALNQASKA